jgi:RHS repeat-associated protein
MNGNRQTVGYDSNGRISQITDGAGRVVLLTRDPNNGYLQKIREQVSSGVYRDTTFTYTNSALTTITYPDGNHTDFTYDANGNIDYVTGIGTGNDVEKLDFSFTSSSPYRVTYMDQSTPAANGSELNFSYYNNRTELTDSENRTEIYEFNDYGNTDCVIGPDGGAEFAKFGTPNSDGSIPGSMSKVTSNTDLQKFGTNYIKNGSCETDTDWTFQGSHVVYATGAGYIGSRGILIGDSISSGDSTFYQWVTLEKGKEYTLSGYMNSNSDSNHGKGALFAAYYDSNGVLQQPKYTDWYSISVDGQDQGWNRFSIDFTVPSDASSTSVKVGGECIYNNGDVWFDCLQLEDGATANKYNIVENPDFNYVTSGAPDKWTEGNCGSSDHVISSSGGTKPDTMSDNSFEFTGDASTNKYIDQTLNICGNQGNTFTVGGWVKGHSIPIPTGNTTIKFGIAIKFDYINEADTWQILYFSSDIYDWQYLCQKVVADDDYQNCTIRVEYNYNANTADFDGIQVYSGGSDNQYDYDSNGNLTKMTYPDGKTEQLTYYSGTNNVHTHTYTDGKVTTYTYDSNNNVKTVATATGITTTYDYDSYGNLLDTKVGGTTNYIKNSAAYDSISNNNYMDYKTDPFGKVMNYSYDPFKGTLSNSTDPFSNEVDNTYDSNTDQLKTTSLTTGGITVSNSYTYTNDHLTQISHNAPNNSSVDYNINYNTLGWNTGTSVGDQPLVTNSLQDRTGNINSVTYHNGGTSGDQTINYTYDDYDRPILISDNSTPPAPLYSIAYDNRGNIGYIKDYVQNVEYFYEYDVLNRTAKIMRRDGSGIWSTSSYTFNASNLISEFREDNTNYQVGTDFDNIATSYTYNDDGKPTATMITHNSDSENITYDTLGRLSSYNYKWGTDDDYDVSIGYYTGTECTRTSRIQTMTYTNFQGSQTLTYTYDDRGYITCMQKDANNYSQYRYDALGELVRENYKWNGTSYTMIYAYDVGGNITSKTKYAFVDGDGPVVTLISTVAYGYNSTAWKDKLTSYNGTTISYDNIGNPLSDGTWNYTWTQGRELQQISNGTTTASYKYNKDGIRTEKTVNGTTTIYNVVGDRVTWEKTGNNNPIYYYYDPNGKLVGLDYNGVPYFYIYNAQGDIIKIAKDITGYADVEYTYDAWGNCSISGDMASTLGVDNPYRYRGYRYDNETGLYYLQSRYYNPVWGRFINSDMLIGNTGSLQANNMFEYCFNDPIQKSDSSGADSLLDEFLKMLGLGSIIATDDQTNGEMSGLLNACSPGWNDNYSASEKIGADIIANTEDNLYNTKIVVDVSLSAGTPINTVYGKAGFTGLISLNGNPTSIYLHGGIGTASGVGLPLSPSFTIATVSGVNKPKDYSGLFIDCGFADLFGSSTDIGFPNYKIAQSGFTITTGIGIYAGADYYWTIK